MNLDYNYMFLSDFELHLPLQQDHWTLNTSMKRPHLPQANSAVAAVTVSEIHCMCSYFGCIVFYPAAVAQRMRVAVAGLVLLRDGGGGRAGESCWQSEDGSPTVTAVPPPQDSAERDKERERERAALAVIPQSKAKE